MSKSFYWGTDPQLYTGVQNFSTKITATPTAYGLTAAQATAYAAVAAVWTAAYEKAIDPATRTKSAILAKDSARDQIRLATANLAKIIDGTPTVTPAQRSDLGLNVKKIPGPPEDCGTPYKLTTKLNALGGLELAWKCTNPQSGTMYAIFRSIDGAPATYIGGCGGKKFVDATIPAGTAKVVYQIQAQRVTAVGPWATFEVKFGVSSTGATTTAVEKSNVKLAA